jgi:hypothetical protein
MFNPTQLGRRGTGGPGLTQWQIWVPHLRDSLIVDKVGIRATREPPSFPNDKIPTCPWASNVATT